MGATTLPDPVDELGIYLLPGRIKDPGRALTEARQAEEIGLSVAWLAERYDIKDGGVLAGAIAASTQRITVGLGSVAAGTRHPVMHAALGATMQQTFGDRLLYGLARGLKPVTDPHGMVTPNMAAFEDFCSILKRLWAGETVSYDGPLGHFPSTKLVDPLTVAPPPLLLSTWFPLPKATAVAARVADGIILGSELTVEAVREARRLMDEACEREGRDPATLKLYVIVIAAPDVSSDEELAVVGARMITHLGFAGIGDLLVKANDWDLGVMRRLMGTDELGEGETADQKFHRDQLLELGASLPREWIETGAAVGSSADVARHLREYVDAGADHLILHGCPPPQFAEVLRIWAAEKTAGVAS